MPHFDSQKPVILHTDASEEALGVVVLQKDKRGEFPIAYGSRALLPAEKNYCTTEKECLAVIWGLRKFYPFVYGRNVTVVTDHNPLVCLRRARDPHGRLARWQMILENYDLSFQFKPGKIHSDADALSRHPSPESREKVEVAEDPVPTLAFSVTELISGQSADVKLHKIKEMLLNPGRHLTKRLRRTTAGYFLRGGVLYKRRELEGRKVEVIALPANLRRSVLQLHHDDVMAGHMGLDKTLNRIQSRYVWPRMVKNIKKYVATCLKCQVRRIPNPTPRSPLQPIQFDEAFTAWGIDLMGPLPRSVKGNRYIVVATEYFSRWIETKALRKATAEEVAGFIQEQIILRHGAPKRLLSDRGAQFLSGCVKALCSRAGIKQSFTSGYRPQVNGLTERVNRTIGEMLAKYVRGDHKDWDTYLPFVTYAYNTACHRTTGKSPFQIMHGRQARTVDQNELRAGYGRLAIARHFTRFMRIAHQKVKERIGQQRIKSKEHYDKKATPMTDLVQGQKVWVRNFRREVGKAEKFLPKYVGPAEIVRKLGPSTYEVQYLKGRRRKESVNRERLRPFLSPHEAIE